MYHGAQIILGDSARRQDCAFLFRALRENALREVGFHRDYSARARARAEGSLYSNTLATSLARTRLRALLKFLHHLAFIACVSPGERRGIYLVCRGIKFRDDTMDETARRDSP